MLYFVKVVVFVFKSNGNSEAFLYGAIAVVAIGIIVLGIWALVKYLRKPH